MKLFYRMPFVGWGYTITEEAQHNGLTPQEVADTADCLRLREDPQWTLTLGLPTTYACDGRLAFPNGECVARGGAYGNDVWIEFVDVKMCDVRNREEAFAEINLFLAANSIETNRTAIETRGDESIITLYYQPRVCGEGSYVIVKFILLNNDRDDAMPTPQQQGVFARKSGITPSKPNAYFQKYIESKGGR